jgi:hypothetical protein
MDVLLLEIYDRVEVIYTYIVSYDKCKDFSGQTKEDFYQFVNELNESNLEKQTLTFRVGFALDMHFPRHHYRFIHKED